MLHEYYSYELGGQRLLHVDDQSRSGRKASMLESKHKTERQKVHMHSPSRMGFLDLPGELRNRIYRLALINHEPINGIRSKLPAIQLLRLCKKIHEEASSVLYHENTFTFGIEANWTNLERLRLHSFPANLGVWPANTYHKWLRKLHIGISFTPGTRIDFQAPPFVRDDIAAMRKAYDERWDDLDITYEICEGTTHRLTFTMAWLKFRFLAPIAHPNCKIITQHNIPPLVQWCLQHTLQQRDIKSSLTEEQLSALAEAHNIAHDSYHSGMRHCITDLSWRLVWGCPWQIAPTRLFQPGGLFGQPNVPLPGMRTRMYDQSDIYRRINNAMTDHTAREILLEDNELRILAALEMPQEKNLLIKGCAELRMYFTLQEMAMKITALTRSLPV